MKSAMKTHAARSRGGIVWNDTLEVRVAERARRSSRECRKATTRLLPPSCTAPDDHSPPTFAGNARVRRPERATDGAPHLPAADGAGFPHHRRAARTSAPRDPPRVRGGDACAPAGPRSRRAPPHHRGDPHHARGGRQLQRRGPLVQLPGRGFHPGARLRPPRRRRGGEDPAAAAPDAAPPAAVSRRVPDALPPRRSTRACARRAPSTARARAARSARQNAVAAAAIVNAPPRTGECHAPDAREHARRRSPRPPRPPSARTSSRGPIVLRPCTRSWTSRSPPSPGHYQENPPRHGRHAPPPGASKHAAAAPSTPATARNRRRLERCCTPRRARRR